MNKIVNLSREERRELWSSASQQLQPLPDFMIEKDFWVCFALQHLFALPGARDHFIFKAGTSLAKVWRAIHRFSEDIDISMSREWLGFTGDRDPEAAQTRAQRTKLLTALSAVCAKKVQEELGPALHQSFSAALGRKDWSLEVDPKDEQTLLFNYPSVFPEITGRSYVRQLVKIECGARSDRWPVSEGRVVAYVGEAFPDTLPDVGVDVPVLDIERTFWEKALILHAEAHRPQDKPVPERYSRHYADVAALAKSESATGALERDDLRARVVAHKSVFFPAAWAKYETAVPGTFRLLPPKERVSELARDYSSMQEMFSASRWRGAKCLMCWRISRSVSMLLLGIEDFSKKQSGSYVGIFSRMVTNGDNSRAELFPFVPVRQSGRPSMSGINRHKSTS